MKPGQVHPLDVKAKETRGTAQRKLSRDGKTWSPTELVKRNRMLKRYCKAGRKGVEVSSGNSEAYGDWYSSFNWGRCKCIQNEPGVLCGFCTAQGGRMETEEGQLAKAMFEAYNAEPPNPGKTHDGKDVPPFEQLGEQVQAKWMAAAREAISILDPDDAEPESTASVVP